MSEIGKGVTFSNPRKSATIENWPYGTRGRVTATFVVETDARHGERVARITTGKPKRTTYAREYFICDGDDGFTYLIAVMGAMIVIHPGTMKYARSIFNDEPEHASILEMLGSMVKRSEIEVADIRMVGHRKK